jgi:hypothetical protein
MMPTEGGPSPRWSKCMRSIRRFLTLYFAFTLVFMSGIFYSGSGGLDTVRGNLIIHVVLLSIVNVLFLCAERWAFAERGAHAVGNWLGVWLSGE